ncbi:serine hydrolase domain-containing protein [Neolewinella persica]|uniref:serine hydrolase domain-containing protein n=1 Tax=Neolewinella persica TaxID=70998 RepID=UPI00035F9A8D|nr:serine hydrolase [Neolewinella persica]
MLRYLPLLLLCFSCGEPAPELVLNEGEIYDDSHRTNVGKIVFMTDWISYEDFREADHLTTVDLNTTTELNGRMFLDKTITAHLHDLAPGLSVRELCDAGSFQFTFLVDGAVVYVNNLQTGAGSCEDKNEVTVFGIPLRGAEEQDHWGRFLWMKFMKLGGGETALDGGNHLLEIEVRPYLDKGEVVTGPLIAKGGIRVNTTEREVDPAKVVVQAIAPTDRFPTTEDVLDSDRIEAMNRKIATGQFEDITSVVVLKNGALVLEEYFNGADRTTIHDTRSVGKSFAGALLGQAIKAGHLKSIDQPLAGFYDLNKFGHPSSFKAKTTLRQLLTMTAGFASDDADPDSPGQEEKMYPTRDWVRFTLDLPAREKTDWQYSSAGVVVLGDIVHRLVPGGLEAFAARQLFSPLGITDQQWQRTPTGVGNTAGSLQMSSLSLAAFGQLYLDGGRDLLPAGWAEESLSPLVARNDDKDGHYGYLFWHDVLTVNGATYPVAYASGNGGNKVMMIPGLEVVVVITGTAYGMPYAHLQTEEMVENYLLEAILVK